MIRIILSFVFLLVQQSLLGQVVVEQQLSHSSILIGEQVLLQTRVAVDEGSSVHYPSFQHQEYIPGVEILKEGKIDTTFLNNGRRVELTRNYLLTSFDSALYSLPPFEVVVGEDTFSSETGIGLKVGTVPVDTTNANNFAGPHGVIGISYEWSAGLWIKLLFAIGLLCLVIYLVKRIAINKPLTQCVVVTPPPPPHQTAIEAIERIRGSRSISSTEELKSYYDELTGVLRDYIKKRFGFNALELTSAEIIARLQQTNDAAALRELCEVLETADLVKFAKYETSLSETDRSLFMALDYVNITKQKPEELPVPELKVVTVGEVKQQRVRISMIVIAVVASALALVLLGVVIKDIYDCFL